MGFAHYLISPLVFISSGSRQLCPENIALTRRNTISFLSSPKLQVQARSKLNFCEGKEEISLIQKGVGRKEKQTIQHEGIPKTRKQ